MTQDPAMRPDVILRPATQADVPVVMRLIRGLADFESMSQELTATETDVGEALSGSNPYIQAVLAEVDGASVGLALFYYTFNTFKARRNIFLEDLFVEPAHRGTGIGLALMRHLAQRAVTENCGRIQWNVLNWNQLAIDFYERLGGKPSTLWHTRQLQGAALAALAKGTSDG
jgi:GNAT superfamily N-acetyltransferase